MPEIKLINNHNNRAWDEVERLYVSGFIFHFLIGLDPSNQNYGNFVRTFSAIGKLVTGEADADYLNNNPDVQEAFEKIETISLKFFQDGKSVFTALDEFIASAPENGDGEFPSDPISKS